VYFPGRLVGPSSGPLHPCFGVSSGRLHISFVSASVFLRNGFGAASERLRGGFGSSSGKQPEIPKDSRRTPEELSNRIRSK